ncbi:MAG TPA: hypothetical protein VGN12_08635 [Pirellulales bacterium]|jgi:hypothetical protein
MADDFMTDREQIDKRVCEVLAEIKLDGHPAETRASLDQSIRNVRDVILAEVGRGKLTLLDWPEIEAILRGSRANV